MPKPAFVLVPGASHQPTIYNTLATILSNHSYEVHPIALPSVVTPGNRATYDFTEDVNSIRNLVSSLVHANKEVILVMHSYSGLPGSEALRGLGKIDREREGKRGGVVRLIFVMGWMGKEGFQGAERGDISSFFPYLRPDVAAGTLTIDPQEAPSIYYNDLPLPEARYWTSQLLPQSIGVFWSRITYAAWRYIPSTYVLCGADQCTTLAYGEMILKAAQDSRPNAIDVVETCETAGHCVMLSQPDWMARMCRRAAGENV